MTVKMANAIQKRKSDAKGKKQSELHREMVSPELVPLKKEIFGLIIDSSVNISIMLRSGQNHKI